METALHQDARSSQVQCLLDFVEDSRVRKNVTLRMAHRPVERAEAAILRAEIRVVDIAIDDITDHAFGMEFAAYSVGRHADSDQIIGGEQVRGFLAGNHTATNSSRA